MKKPALYTLFASFLILFGCANNNSEDIEIACQTEVSLSGDILPLLEAQCTFSGCHNGDNGASRNWTQKDNVIALSAGIKARTQSGSMPRSPGELTAAEVEMIACWVDQGAKDN